MNNSRVCRHTLSVAWQLLPEGTRGNPREPEGTRGNPRDQPEGTRGNPREQPEGTRGRPEGTRGNSLKYPNEPNCNVAEEKQQKTQNSCEIDEKTTKIQKTCEIDERLLAFKCYRYEFVRCSEKNTGNSKKMRKFGPIFRKQG